VSDDRAWQAPEGRKHRSLQGRSVRSTYSRKHAHREREPWLLVASPELTDLNASQLVALYAKRMQIAYSGEAGPAFRLMPGHRSG
jgi:hypothetical protein